MTGNEHLTPPVEVVAIARHVQDLVAAAYARELRRLDPATHDELAVAILVDRALANPGDQFSEHDDALEHAPVSNRRALSRLTKAFPETRPVGFGSASTAAGILLRRDGDRMIAASHYAVGNALFRNAVRVDSRVFWIDGTQGAVELGSGLTGGVYATATSNNVDRSEHDVTVRSSLGRDRSVTR